MTRTEELLGFCDRIHSKPKVEVDWWVLEELTKLVRLQHEALKEFVEPIEKRPYLCVIDDGRNAIAEFNKFEGGE